MGANGSLTNVDNVTDNAELQLAGAHSLTTGTIGGSSYVFAGGRVDNGISVFSVGANGALSNVANVHDSALLAQILEQGLTVADVGGSTYLFAAAWQSADLAVYKIGGDGSLTPVEYVADDATLNLLGASAVTTAVVGSTTYLFASGYYDSGISAFSVAADGSLSNVANVKDAGYLHLERCSTLGTMNLDGITYLVAGGYYDGGFSVFAVGADGSLTNVSNVDTPKP